jgi:hypothetical protein
MSTDHQVLVDNITNSLAVEGPVLATMRAIWDHLAAANAAKSWMQVQQLQDSLNYQVYEIELAWAKKNNLPLPPVVTTPAVIKPVTPAVVAKSPAVVALTGTVATSTVIHTAAPGTVAGTVLGVPKGTTPGAGAMPGVPVGSPAGTPPGNPTKTPTKFS